MFIKSNSVSFTCNAMTHAMLKAVLNTYINTKLENSIADYLDNLSKNSHKKANLSHDWTARIHTRKNQLIVKALMA